MAAATLMRILKRIHQPQSIIHVQYYVLAYHLDPIDP
jgi:hypothetical protein